MKVNDFAIEFDNLIHDRQKEGLKKLFDELIDCKGHHSELVEKILELASDYERDDGFGTEGLDI